MLYILKRFGMEESNPTCNLTVRSYKLYKDEEGLKVDENSIQTNVRQTDLHHNYTTKLDVCG